MFKKIFDTLKKHFAFNMLEVTLSLITIALVASALTPVITKKATRSSIAVRKVTETITDCSKLKPAGCPTTLGTECKLCYRDKCIACNKTCPPGQTLNTKCCTCGDCAGRDETGACNLCGDKDKGAKNCDSCKGGYYLCKIDYKCRICPEGHQCPEGEYCPIPCEEDKWSSQGSNVCDKPCPAGKYCHKIEEAFSECNLCNNKNKQEDCHKGHYCEQGKKMEKCFEGYYQDTTGQTSCKYCPKGKWSCAPGETDKSKCIGRASVCTDNCERGYYCPGDGTKIECPIGSYCPEGSGEPILCPAGKYTDKAGQWECLTCPCGTSSNMGENKTGSTGCTDCGKGNYSTEGSSKCTACTTGHYCPDDKTCTPTCCPGGTYQDNVGESECKNCSAGAFQSGSCATKCSTCPPGQSPSADGTTCQGCECGYYSNEENGYSCNKCPEGTYSSAGASSCTACPAGKYCQQGACTPTQCPAGHYCPTANTSVPTACPCGHYCPAGTTSPIACGKGKFSTENASGLDECTSCIAGHNCPKDATCPSDVQECPCGTYCPTGSSAVTNCGTGKYSAAKASSCTSCPAGYKCQKANTCVADIVACGPGTYSNGGGSATCHTCPANSYSNAAANSTCTNCGWCASSGAGASSCTTCGTKHYCPAVGQHGCGKDVCAYHGYARNGDTCHYGCTKAHTTAHTCHHNSWTASGHWAWHWCSNWDSKHRHGRGCNSCGGHHQFTNHGWVSGTKWCQCRKNTANWEYYWNAACCGHGQCTDHWWVDTSHNWHWTTSCNWHHNYWTTCWAWGHR